MHSITCIGKDDVERIFVFDDPEEDMTSEGHRELLFCVKRHPEDMWFFELQLREKPDGQFQIISIQHHHRPEYASMGIPDSLLPYLTGYLGRRICSSRGRVEGTNEFRTVQATGMWDRLVQKGLAEYFAEEGVYRTSEPHHVMNRDIAQQIATLLNTQNELTVVYDADKILQAADRYIYRLGEDAKVVGAVEVKKVQWYQCEIDHLSSVVKCRGTGSSLLAEALARAEHLGARVAQCTIRVGNQDSERFFTKHGFTPTVTFLNHENGNQVTVYQKTLALSDPRAQ
jgi:GNAT superfamily N-acetyltransferase